MIDPRHPPQREMWEGLSSLGCLGLLVFLGAITIILPLLFS